MKEIFEWNRLLFNNLPPEFLLEVVFRCVIMFAVVLIILKLTGKRGIKQLSIFELVIIITLGSAAGDPMFYEDVGMLPAITVSIVVLILYRLITWALSKYQAFEHWIEGKPIYLIEEGVFSFKNFKKEDLALDEFFAELRLRNIDHLGQVRLAILETTGSVSVFFYDDEQVKFGLPILPHDFNNLFENIPLSDTYSCVFCGNTKELKPANEVKCERCERNKWIPARSNKRIG